MLGYSSVVQRSLSMSKALNSIPNLEEENSKVGDVVLKEHQGAGGTGTPVGAS